MANYDEIKKNLYEKINNKLSENVELSLLQDFCLIEIEKIIIKQELDITNDSEAHQACELYGNITWDYFFKNEFYSAGFAILYSGWDLFCKIQKETKKHIYRASIGAFIAMRYRFIGDNAAKFRWSLLTEGADLLDGHNKDGGTGKDLLITDFGLDKKIIREMKKIALINLAIINQTDDWSIPEAFSEDVLTKFAYKNPEYASYFSLNTSIHEFRINTIYFEALFNRSNSTAATTTDQGNRLEDLATYLFLLIPGLVPRRNILESTDAFESDIVVSNHTMNSNLISELLGRHFLVECKNWKDPVSVKDVGYFLYRMRLTHAKFGIIFAKNGITGKEEEKAANSLIRKAFHEDGIICIVINNSNLEKIKNSTISFWPFILEKVEKLRFGTEKKK